MRKPGTYHVTLGERDLRVVARYYSSYPGNNIDPPENAYFEIDSIFDEDGKELTGELTSQQTTDILMLLEDNYGS